MERCASSAKAPECLKSGCEGDDEYVFLVIFTVEDQGAAMCLWRFRRWSSGKILSVEKNARLISDGWIAKAVLVKVFLPSQRNVIESRDLIPFDHLRTARIFAFVARTCVQRDRTIYREGSTLAVGYGTLHNCRER